MSITSKRVALGLVSVRDRPTVECPVTDVLEDFKVDLERIEAGGETALWDGVIKAVEMLAAYSAERTEPPRLRIIALTDGMDTRSMNTMSHAADALRAHDITLDGVVVCASNFELPALARFSGGHSLLPETAEAAIAAFEADPMLLLAWRAEAAQRWNGLGSSLSTPTSPSLPQSLRTTTTPPPPPPPQIMTSTRRSSPREWRSVRRLRSCCTSGAATTPPRRRPPRPFWRCLRCGAPPAVSWW